MSSESPPRLTARNRRGVFFVVGMLLAIAAFIFVVAPSEWFERNNRPAVNIETLSEHDPQHQLTVLTEMWAKHPDHAPIALQIAQLYSDRGEHEKAVDYYRAFLKVDTTSNGYEAGLDLAQALFHLRLTDDAIVELKRIIKKNPGHPGALYNWGAIAANSGDAATARSIWNELIQLHPTDTLAIFAKKSLPLLDKPAGHP